MSSNTKGSPPDAGSREPTNADPQRPALDQTVLGVSPLFRPKAADPAAAAPAPGAASPGAPAAAPPIVASPIIAAPMIAVSGSSSATPAQPAAAPRPAAPAAPAGAPPRPAAPAQPAAPAIAAQFLQPAAMNARVDQTQMYAPPAREPAPPPAPPHGLSGGWQSAPLVPRGREQTLLVPGAKPPPQPAPQPAPTPAPEPVRPVEVRPTPVPAAAQPARASAGLDPALQRTALASDYLRAARDAMLGQARAMEAEAPVPAGPGAHGSRGAPARPLEERAAPLRAAESIAPLGENPPETQAPVTAPPLTEPPETVTSPVEAEPRRANTAHAWEAASPAPVARPAEPADGPVSIGTKASIAPPRDALEPTREREAPKPPLVSLEPEAPRAAPRHAAATMLAPPPSARPAPDTAPVDDSAAKPPAASPFATRFEPVPSTRAPLSEQMPGSFLPPASVEESRAGWQEPGSQRGPSDKKQKPKDNANGLPPARTLVLAAVAIGAIVFVTFQQEILGSRQPQPRWPSTVAGAATAGNAEPESRATLSNLPSTPPAEVTPPPEATPPAAPSAADAVPTSPADTVDEEPPSEDEPAPARGKKKGKRRGAAAADDRDTEATREAASSPESQLAASAARHAIAGRYSEALAQYQQLARDWPQNTAYAAMVRVLRQKSPGAAESPAAPTTP